MTVPLAPESQAKSTNVRTSGWRERALRGAFRLLNGAAPGLAARWAEELFFTPPSHPASHRMRRFLASGRPFSVPVDGARVAAWSWGSGPAVLLIHGWSGRAGQMAPFVPGLVARGFRAVAFDAPGHGASAGRRSSVIAFAGALRAVALAAGPAHGVIAHSLGGSAAALALWRGLDVERAVFVGPPADPESWTRQFAARFGVAPAVMEAMKRRAERRLRFRWEDLRVPALARTCSTPLLVVHDREDADVPWEEGAAIAQAWPGARFLTTSGLGHRRILRDPEVVSRAVDFVAGDRSGPREDLPSCGAHALEAELFDRDRRWRRVFPSSLSQGVLPAHPLKPPAPAPE